ncbi:MAG TPA: cytochrome c [Hyphomicrobiaceae bacterium]|nr:cytochrome c [Hyphomicrobiaceae bacterium]
MRMSRCTIGFLLILFSAGASFAQTRPAPRSFDYWQPDWMVRELWGPGRMPKSMMARLLRHSTYIQFGVPEPYAGATSNLPAGPETIAAGRKLYAENCSTCHGMDGLGDGDQSKAVAPSPALLAYMIRRPVSVDEYLLWSISDGGAQFETDMPAFKDKLSRDDIWRIVAYMRAGFPQPESEQKK